MVEIEIFVKKDCPFCPRAKELVEKVSSEFEGVTIKEIDIETDRGKEEATNLAIMTAPTVIIAKDIRFTGVPREELLRESIKKELEMEKNEKRKEE